MTKSVPRKQAETLLLLIKQHYNTWPQTSGPNLRDHNHEELQPGSWSIDWDGGPDEWAYTAYEFLPQGLLYEPINAFILGVHPE